MCLYCSNHVARDGTRPRLNFCLILSELEDPGRNVVALPYVALVGRRRNRARSNFCPILSELAAAALICVFLSSVPTVAE